MKLPGKVFDTRMTDFRSVVGHSQHGLDRLRTCAGYLLRFLFRFLFESGFEPWCIFPEREHFRRTPL